jgi:hypothetical protein
MIFLPQPQIVDMKADEGKEVEWRQDRNTAEEIQA